MTTEPSLAVILHADIVNSTADVQRDEVSAHIRFQEAFRLLSEAVTDFQGRIREVRGDALVAEFSRASDAIQAAARFQGSRNAGSATSPDDRPTILRIGIALGEVVLADGTVFPEKGRITFADASLSEKTGTFLLRAELPISSGSMSMRATFALGPKRGGKAWPIT